MTFAYAMRLSAFKLINEARVHEVRIRKEESFASYILYHKQIWLPRSLIMLKSANVHILWLNATSTTKAVLTPPKRTKVRYRQGMCTRKNILVFFQFFCIFFHFYNV